MTLVWVEITTFYWSEELLHHGHNNKHGVQVMEQSLAPLKRATRLF